MIRKLQMQIRRDGGELLKKRSPLYRDRSAETRKLLVPWFDHAGIHRVGILQQRVPLLERGVVPLQRVVICGLEL